APDPRQIAPRRNIPASLAEIVKKALAKKPGQRFSDAHEFADALSNALADLDDAPERMSVAVGAAPSLMSGESIECEACGYEVPRARYCCECAAPLPQDRSVQFPLPFVGRAEELSWLQSRRPQAAQISGVRLVGEAGVGKSRLLEEFSRMMSAQGDQVISVGPDPYDSKIAYYCLGQAILGLTRFTQDDLETR